MNSFKKFVEEGVFDSIKSKLNPEIWFNNKLNSQLRKFILTILYRWLKEKNIDKSKVVNVRLTGSLAGFEYGKKSDLDVSVILDLTDGELKELWDDLPNGEFFDGIKYPINFNIRNKWKESWENDTNGVYDLIGDKWFKEPTSPKKNPFDRYKAVEDTARFFIAGISSVIAEYKADVDAYNSFKDYTKSTNSNTEDDELQQRLKFKIQEIIDDIDSLKIAKHVLHNLRDEAFNVDSLQLDRDTDDETGNESLNNLLYKHIESLGYFETIKKIVDKKDVWLDRLKENKG